MRGSWINESHFQGESNPPDSSEVQKKRPVESVNWYHSIAFCNKLSQECGLDPCYTVYDVNFETLDFDDIPTRDNYKWNNAVCDWSKNGFRLPTEAEWEWAAKGRIEDKWAGTNDESNLKDYAWYNNNSGYKTHEVKKKLPNGYGLYDMSGNVAEWCWDWYVRNGTPAGGQDPIGAASGVNRVLRSGSWSDGSKFCFVGRRLNNKPDRCGGFVGLRVACRP